MDGDLSAFRSKPGRVRCLRCQDFFNSPDRCRVRICPGCKRDRDDERCGKLADHVVECHDVSIPEPEGGDYYD